jgi:CheY-like chemotaxis protein/HPt (histidine-containing phosphotransfer) domain-containing protein/signal transduction histidine kinase
MTKFTSLDFNHVLNDRERCIILHSLEGDILGASPKACHELGYSQEEIVQLLLANIKALDLRLSDVCLKHQEDAPIVFQRRNGRRFPAKVSSKVTRIHRDRQEQSVVQLEFVILADVATDNTTLPKFDLQESADYLEVLSEEIHRPLVNLGFFLEQLSGNALNDNFPAKLNHALNHHRQLLELTSDVADWFKLGTNILHLDRQPFNLIGLMDRVTALLEPKCHEQQCSFSICIENDVNELAFGDSKRVGQLLQRLILKALSLHQANQLRLFVRRGGGEDATEISFSLIVHNYSAGRETQTTRPEPGFTTDDTGPGLIGKLIKILGGQLKQHRRSDVEYEYFFSLAIPDVDTLDIKSNPKFLSGHRILLIDNEDTLLKYQLIQWGAEVEFFLSWAKAENYLSQVTRAQQYTLKIFQLSSEQHLLESLPSNASLAGPCVWLTRRSQCTIDKLGASYIPWPSQPGLLGNALATLVQQEIPYPYSRNHNARIVDVRDTRPTILFVDDVETIRLTFQALLEKANYKVDLAQNGIDAILACDQNRYDLIIIDIQMPFMDGIEASSHIRNSKNSNQRTPILAVTGDISENNRIAVEKVGIHALHPKSSPNDELLVIVGRLTGQRESPRTDKSIRPSPKQLLKNGRRASETDGHSIATKSCLNEESLNNLVADTSLEVCTEMVDIFMQESKQSVASIDEASLHNNWQQVKNEAHAIKSTSHTFGCEALYHIASQLELEIEHGNLQKSKEIVDEMAAIFSQSYLALEEYFHSAGKSLSPPQ